MTVRVLLCLGLLLFACGGEGAEPQRGILMPTAGAGGQAQAGASSSVAGSDAQQGGSTTVAGSGSDAGSAPQAGTGGDPQPAGGMAGAGGTGTPGEQSAGSGGAATAGTNTGGSPSDPLEPVPAANCPGYFDVSVPAGTCMRIRGKFTNQTLTCTLQSPTEKSCGMVTAGDTASGYRFSETVGVADPSGVQVDRFDLVNGLCPETCN